MYLSVNWFTLFFLYGYIYFNYLFIDLDIVFHLFFITFIKNIIFRYLTRCQNKADIGVILFKLMNFQVYGSFHK